MAESQSSPKKAKRSRTTKETKENMLRQEGNESFICNFEECGKIFLSKPALYTHQKNKSHHEIERELKVENNSGRPRKNVQPNDNKNKEESSQENEGYFRSLEEFREKIGPFVSANGYSQIHKTIREDDQFKPEEVKWKETNLKNETDQLQEKFERNKIIDVFRDVQKKFLLKFFHMKFLERFCPLIIAFLDFYIEKYKSSLDDPKSWLNQIAKNEDNNQEEFECKLREISLLYEELERKEFIDRFIEMFRLSY